MIKTLIILVVSAIIIFEVIEHVLFPLVWFIFSRKKRSISGEAGMLGRTVEVRIWSENKGQVSVSGELWKAVSDSPLRPGDEAVVAGIDGLTLTVEAGPKRLEGRKAEN